jgi:nitrogen fixation protein NifU and related proteins
MHCNSQKIIGNSMDKKLLLYTATIMDHYHSPRLAGIVEHPDFDVEVINEACGDKVRLTGTVKDGILTAVRHEGKGCILSQAYASMLAEYVLNQSIRALQAMTEEQVGKVFDLQLGPYRLRCALLAFVALKKGIEDYA